MPDLVITIKSFFLTFALTGAIMAAIGLCVEVGGPINSNVGSFLLGAIPGGALALVLFFWFLISVRGM